MTIDGYTQPGATPNSLDQGDNATLLIEVSGQAIKNFGTAGLQISGGASVLRGLIVNNFSGNAIDLLSSSNVVQGCFVGTDAFGVGNHFGYGAGISVGGGAGNLIGGTTPDARNLISGLGRGGVSIGGEGVSRTLVQGNFIGTNPSGKQAVPNYVGVIVSDSSDNIIGGVVAGSRNIISGNGLGITITGRASRNIVAGNFIGTDVSGRARLPNGSATASGQNDGVIIDFADSNVIGGTTPGARNVISGNNGSGITLVNNFILTGRSVVQGNFIGVDVTGTNALGNGRNGIDLGGSGGNTAIGMVIGGPEAGAGNVISSNSGEGVALFDGASSNNIVQGNYIGTDLSGTRSLGNDNGVDIADAVHNDIGLRADGSGSGNVIAFNRRNGVRITASSRTPVVGDSVRGNSIFSNGSVGRSLGIALGNAGVLVNQPCGGGKGPNRLQNFPVITSAVRGGARSASEQTERPRPCR